jgi:hypothetical protein
MQNQSVRGESRRNSGRRWLTVTSAASGLMLLASSLHGVSIAAAQSVSVPVVQVDDHGADVADDRLLNPMADVRQEDQQADRAFEVGDDRLTGEIELGDLRQEDRQADRAVEMEIGDDRVAGAVSVSDDHGSNESGRHGRGHDDPAGHR